MKKITKNKFEKALSVVKAYREQAQNEYDEIISAIEGNINPMGLNQETLIGNSGLSKRTKTVLWRGFDIDSTHKIIEAQQRVTKDLLLKTRNAGKATLEEIECLFERVGLTLINI
jgi:hypothetical protein